MIELGDYGEEVECEICSKPVDEHSEWDWNEEPAHAECVLERADRFCIKCGFYFMAEVYGYKCGECGSKKNTIKLTPEIKESHLLKSKESKA